MSENIDKIIERYYRNKKDELKYLVNEGLRCAMKMKEDMRVPGDEENEQLPAPNSVNLNDFSKQTSKDGFAGLIQTIIGKMLGMNNVNIKLKGKKNVIERFMKVLKKEKDYILKVSELGPENAQVVKCYEELGNEIRKFEEVSNLSWPYK